jgi:hypothetical protein
MSTIKEPQEQEISNVVTTEKRIKQQKYAESQLLQTTKMMMQQSNTSTFC